MLTSFLSEYLAQLFNVTIRVCCSTKYRKHNCVLQPEKLKGAFQGETLLFINIEQLRKMWIRDILRQSITIDILIFIFQPGKIHFVILKLSASSVYHRSKLPLTCIFVTIYFNIRKAVGHYKTMRTYKCTNPWSSKINSENTTPKPT